MIKKSILGRMRECEFCTYVRSFYERKGEKQVPGMIINIVQIKAPELLAIHWKNTGKICYVLHYYLRVRKIITLTG